MKTVIEATEWFRKQKDVQEFNRWFEKRYYKADPRVRIIPKEIAENFTKEAWNRCDSIWRNKMTSIKEVLRGISKNLEPGPAKKRIEDILNHKLL